MGRLIDCLSVYDQLQIGWYSWKTRIGPVHQEFLETCSWGDGDEDPYYAGIVCSIFPDVRIYNHRELEENIRSSDWFEDQKIYHIGQIARSRKVKDGFQIVDHLPKRYWFSSGFNSPVGYFSEVPDICHPLVGQEMDVWGSTIEDGIRIRDWIRFFEDRQKFAQILRAHPDWVNDPEEHPDFDPHLWGLTLGVV